jgi:hypothetical protein
MVQRVSPLSNAAPYLFKAASWMLTAKVIENVVKGVFPALQDIQKTFITLIGTVVALNVLTPFTATTYTYLGIACLVTSLTHFAYEGKKTASTVPPKPPHCIKPLLNHPIGSPIISNPPESMKKVLEQIKPGQLSSFKRSDGWDFDFFHFSVQQKKELAGYYFQLFTGTTSEEVDQLQSYLVRHLTTVVLFTAPLPKSLQPSSTTYFISYSDSEDAIPLSALDESDSIALIQAFVKGYPQIDFAGNSLKVFYDYAQKNRMPLFTVIRQLQEVFKELPIGITTDSTNPNQLHIYSLTHKNAPQLLVAMANELRIRLGLDVIYRPQGEIVIPSFLRNIPKGNLQDERKGHVLQIEQALGGEREPHAMVVGSNAGELEHILTMVQDRQVVKMNSSAYLNNAEHHLQQLIEYLWSHPSVILYTPSSKLLHNSVLTRQIPPQTSIVLGDGQHDVEGFKKVQLMPLTQMECMAEVRRWCGAKSITFEDKALEIALEATFILHSESGAEYSFVQDLIERASKIGVGPISAESIWKTFISLYEPHRKSIMSQQEQCISLVRIAMKLKAKYGITLPVREVKLTDPPEFLTDLNEQVKSLHEFAVSLNDRSDALSDALQGEYTNAMLIGSSGTGKTTLVRWAAWMSANNRFDETHALCGKTIYMLNLNAFMQNARWLGTVEHKIDVLFNFLLQAKNAVLFIDEIHRVMGAGAAHGNEMGTISQHMKTYLEDSKVCAIGATTKSEYERWVVTDEAFARRFNNVELAEPKAEDVKLIFTHYVATTRFKNLHSTLVITTENIGFVYEKVKDSRSQISPVDQGKKLLELIARNAKRASRYSVDAQFIQGL